VISVVVLAIVGFVGVSLMGEKDTTTSVVGLLALAAVLARLLAVTVGYPLEGWPL